MPREPLIDRAALWALRSIATLVVFSGVSALVAAVPVLGLFSGSPVATSIAAAGFQIATVLIIGGVSARYLSNPSNMRLPNEVTTSPLGERAALGGWLFALAIVLAALPVWLVFRLQPFVAEWSNVLDLLAALELGGGANANMSGVILVPLAGALTPPFFELLSMVAMLCGSIGLVTLLLIRSPRFPRIYLVWLVITSTLVVVSYRGAAAVLWAGGLVEQLIADTSANAVEATQLRGILSRYTTAVGATAPVLVWALFGYLAWAPAILVSRRTAATFAQHTARRGTTASAGALDMEAITSPPRFPH